MTRLGSLRHLGLGFTALLLGLSASPTSQAGDPGFYVPVTNMTPDAQVDDAGKQCARLFSAYLEAPNDVDIEWRGETELRRLAGNPDRSISFLNWTPKDWKPFKTTLAIDCRPTERRVDLVVISEYQRAVFRLRGEEISKERIQWLAEATLGRIRGFFWQ